MSTLAHLLRRQTLALAAAGLVSLVPISQALAGDPVPGGTLRYAIAAESDALVALTNTSGTAVLVGPKIFDGLLTYDNDLNPSPQLATSWETSPDGLRYTFHLRDGVTWHDGQKLTSGDVAFSIQRLKVSQPRGRGTFANVQKVETPDPLTAVIVLSKPAPYLLTALASTESPIVAKHVLESTPPNTTPGPSQLIGTGPFVFKDWVRGDHVTLVKNPNYWDKPKPYLDKIVIRFITDEAAIGAGLETGEIDVTGDLALGDVERLKGNRDLLVEARSVPYSAAQVQAIFNLDHDYVKDQKVREAISHAIDLKGFANFVYFGLADVSPTPISPALTKFHDDEIKPHAYDPELAKKILDDAGYKVKTDGWRFPLTLLYNGGIDQRNGAFFKQALQKIGINADLKSYDFATYVKTAYTDRAFDLTVEALNNIFDPAAGVQRIYWSKNFKIGLPFSNGAHYANPKVDDLLEAAAAEPDLAKRKADYKTFQEIVDEELPVINLVANYDVIASRKNVKNVDVGGLGLQNNFATVYIEK
jgi:peptide/nickel transport system substrate-binding protein